MEHPQKIILSFIVPIYGVEQYLCKCVDSLLHQDYENYEIILVDDGSPDKCPAISDEYAAKYDKIRVFHRENGGLSAARNTGIEVAHGEYICFVDSDDYWEDNVLGGLMAQIERYDLEVLRFRWQNVRVRGEGRRAMRREGEYEVFQPYKEVNFVDFSCEPLSGVDYLNQRMGIQCYAWSFILRADLVKGDKAIRRDGGEAMGERFTEGILFEDTDWTPRMLAQAKRVAGTETIVYNYLWRETGITLEKSKEKLERELRDKIILMGKLNEWGCTLWYRTMISSLMVSVIGIIAQYFYAQRNEYLKDIQALK